MAGRFRSTFFSLLAMALLGCSFSSFAQVASQRFELSSINPRSQGTSCSGANSDFQSVLQEVDKTLRTAEFDTEGKLASMEFRGKRIELIYAGSEFVGTKYGEKFTRLSISVNENGKSGTVFVRDDTGKLIRTWEVTKKSILEAPLQREVIYTPESAKNELANRVDVSPQENGVRRKFDGDWDSVFLIKPCFICDAEFTINQGRCALLAGALLGLDVTIFAAACAGSAAAGAGFLCPLYIIEGVAYAALIDAFYSECSEWAKRKLVECRGNCT